MLHFWGGIAFAVSFGLLSNMFRGGFVFTVLLFGLCYLIGRFVDIQVEETRPAREKKRKEKMEQRMARNKERDAKILELQQKSVNSLNEKLNFKRKERTEHILEMNASENHRTSLTIENKIVNAIFDEFYKNPSNNKSRIYNGNKYIRIDSIVSCSISISFCTKNTIEYFDEEKFNDYLLKEIEEKYQIDSEKLHELFENRYDLLSKHLNKTSLEGFIGESLLLLLNDLFSNNYQPFYPNSPLPIIDIFEQTEIEIAYRTALSNISNKCSVLCREENYAKKKEKEEIEKERQREEERRKEEERKKEEQKKKEEEKTESIKRSAPIIEPETRNTVTANKKNIRRSKKRFCKYCGSEIDPVTKKCSGCGKQYIKIDWKVVIIAILSFLLVLLVAFGLFNIQMINDQYTEMARKYYGNKSHIGYVWKWDMLNGEFDAIKLSESNAKTNEIKINKTSTKTNSNYKLTTTAGGQKQKRYGTAAAGYKTYDQNGNIYNASPYLVELRNKMKTKGNK